MRDKRKQNRRIPINCNAKSDFKERDSTALVVKIFCFGLCYSSCLNKTLKYFVVDQDLCNINSNSNKGPKQ
jgi:hypothetical protein